MQTPDAPAPAPAASQRTLIIYRMEAPEGYYYIGSTIRHLLSRRLAKHRENARGSNSKCYTHMNSIGWDKVTMHALETLPYTTEEARRVLENSYVVAALSDPLCLNQNRVYVSPEERREYDRQRHIKAYASHHLPAVCECGHATTAGRLSQHQRSVAHRTRAAAAAMAAATQVN